MLIITSVLALALGQAPAGAQASSPQRPPWVVVDRPQKERYATLGYPRLIVLANGDYLVSYEYMGHYNSFLGTFVCRSSDRGVSWARLEKLDSPQWPELFEHRGAVYLVGMNAGSSRSIGSVGIRRSEDGGSTWTPLSEIRGDRMLTPCGSPIVRHGGRIWMAFSRFFVLSTSTGAERRIQFLVGSAPDDADLLSEDAWRWSGEVPTDDLGSGCRASCLLAVDEEPPPQAPESFPTGPSLLLRGGDGVRAVARLSADGWTLRRVLRQEAPRDHPENTLGRRFVQDARTKSFVGLTSRDSSPPEDESSSGRGNVVELMSSNDLLDWESRSTLLHDPDPGEMSFGGADWAIDGDDLLVVHLSWKPKVDQTGLPQGPPGEDAKEASPQAVIFLRVPKFRDRKPDDPPLWGPPLPR